MEWPVLRQALDRLVASSSDPVVLSFTGGEPLLEFPLVARAMEYVTGCVGAGRTVVFHLLTNGFLLDRATLSFFAKHRVQLTISCDGVAAAQNLREPGSFEALDALFRLLRSDHPVNTHSLRISLTLVPAALPHLSASVMYLLSLGMRHITINPAMTFGHWVHDDFQELERQFSQVYRLSLDDFSRTGDIAVTNLRRRKREAGRGRSRPWGCSAPDGRALTVDVDGQVYPCALAARSYQQFSQDLDVRMRELSLGDVRDPGFASRLASLQDGSRRSGLFDPQRLQRSGDRKCATCRYRSDCFVCPIARVHGPSADIHDVPEYQCAFNRIVAKYRRRFPNPAASSLAREVIGRLRHRRLRSDLTAP
jgi:radical SAM protein with 4Fe4S-binding SPASM domain